MIINKALSGIENYLLSRGFTAVASSTGSLSLEMGEIKMLVHAADGCQLTVCYTSAPLDGGSGVIFGKLFSCGLEDFKLKMSGFPYLFK